LALVSGRDFLELKGVLETLLDRLHAERRLEVSHARISQFTSGRAAELKLGGVHLGFLGEIDRSMLDALELREATSAAELEFAVLRDSSVLVPQHHALPPYPSVTRDLSLVVARTLPWAELAASVKRAAGPTLEAVEFLDAFQGGNIPENQHSIHFGLRFRHADRTLTGEEVERSVKAIVDACASRFEATLRA
jgi:phenylalanyl-tRNA synthetase beta chain